LTDNSSNFSHYSGTIGVFDFPTLLTSIVNGLVLLKVASVIVDLMLLYVMPEKSLYKYVRGEQLYPIIFIYLLASHIIFCRKHKYELTEDFSDVRKEKHNEKEDKLEMNESI